MSTTETPLQQQINEKKRKLDEELKAIKYDEYKQAIADLEWEQRKQTIRSEMKLDETYEKWFDLDETQLRKAVKELQKNTEVLKSICKRLYIPSRREFDCTHGDWAGCDLCSPDHY